MLRQLIEAVLDEQAALERTHAYEPYLAVGEVENLKRARIEDQPFDVLRHQLLGADENIDGNRPVAEQLRPAGVLR